MSRVPNVSTSEHRETVHFGQTAITFSVEFRQRKHLGITVYPDLRVGVAAPEGTDLEEIRRRVLKRAPWILKQLDWFDRFRPLPAPRQYLSGETHCYLGKRYRLKVFAGDRDEVKLKGQYLEVETTRINDRDTVRTLVQAWYREHARTLFLRRMEACLPRVTGLTQTMPPVLLRRLQGRWGSCSKAGRILLNVELIQAAVDCIDYVIIHELCHLRIRQHSRAFYQLLSKVMPDWEVRKSKLEKFQI